MPSALSRVESRYSHIATRPLVAVFPAFLAGLLCWTSPWFLGLLLPVAILGRRHLRLAALLFSAGAARGALAPMPPEPLPTGEYTVVGTVGGTPTLGSKWQRLVLVTEGRSLLVYVPSARIITAGDTVRVRGRVEQIVHYSDSPYNLAAYYARRGINQRLSAVYDGAVEVIAPGVGLGAVGSRWRTATYERLREHIGRREAGIAMGIVAGQQSLVEERVIRNMQRAGTLHILSTSGMNVFLIAGFLMLVLAHFPVPKGVQATVAIVLLLTYCAAVGGRPPVVRSTVMISLFLGMYVFGRTPDPLSVLAAAAIGLLLMEPGMAFDAGFQLSFATVGTLCMFGPNGFRWIRLRAEGIRSPFWRVVALWAGASVGTTVLATIGSAPLTAMHFGVVSLVAPFANLATVPFVPFIYLGTLFSQLAEPISELLSRGFDVMLTGTFSAWIDWVNVQLAQPVWAAVEFERLSGTWWFGVVAFYLALVAVSRPDNIPGHELVREEGG